MTWKTWGFLYKIEHSQNLLALQQYFNSEYWNKIQTICHQIEEKIEHQKELWYYLMDYESIISNDIELLIHYSDPPWNKKYRFIRIDVKEANIQEWIPRVQKWITACTPPTPSSSSTTTPNIILWCDKKESSTLSNWFNQSIEWCHSWITKSISNPWNHLLTTTTTANTWYQFSHKISMQLESQIVENYRCSFMIYLVASMFMTIQSKINHECKLSIVEMNAAVQKKSNSEYYEMWNIQQSDEFLQLLYHLQQQQNTASSCVSDPSTRNCAFAVSYSEESESQCFSNIYWNSFPYAVQKQKPSSNPIWYLHCRYFPMHNTIIFEHQFFGTMFHSCYTQLTDALIQQLNWT